jgi:hypothetical protein
VLSSSGSSKLLDPEGEGVTASHLKLLATHQSSHPEGLNLQTNIYMK